MFYISLISPVLDVQSPWLLGGWCLLLGILLLLGAFMNLLGLAGNWVILGLAVANRFLVDPSIAPGYSFGLLGALLLLALGGEGLEFMAGVLGAGKAGGSRRAMVLSVVGGMLGSMVGLTMGNAVVPILGAVLGILLGGGIGSLAGAMLGELWKGSDAERQFQVGRSAFWGRILGTLAKTMVGTLMLLLSLGGLFF
ncbi:DUF456 family protein [Kiritimatiellaeota bacterium B1221]|nr:DUF456 family protein [Kiritimatiellaeota bacterium B1221]